MRTLPACMLYVATALTVVTGCGGGATEAPTTVTVTAAPPTTQQAAAPTTEAPTQVVIPDVTEGQNGAIALEALQRAGLTNVQPASRDEDDRFVVNPANWSVVSVEPGPGTEVSSDSTVVITMTKQR